MLIRAIAAVGAPQEVPLEETQAFGMRGRRARGLVVQERDAAGALWASRGMWAYVLRPGDDRFRRAFHAPTGPTPYWLRNFAAVRRATGHEECIELLPGRDGEAVVMSGGRMFWRDGDGVFRSTLRLRYYGRGIGSGVASTGILRLADGDVLFGEYHQNRERDGVRIWAGDDGGQRWRVAHEFPAGQIKHLHVLEQDPFTGDVWVGTGDRDEESMVLRTADGFASLQPIGSGRQRWRTLTFLFSEDAVFWGTDTGNPQEAGLYRYERASGRTELLRLVPECFFFGMPLTSGTLLLSTDRHGDPIERDGTTRLWLLSPDGAAASLACGNWVGSGRFGILRLPRGGPHPDVAFTCLNLADHHGDLFVYPESALRERAEAA